MLMLMLTDYFEMVMQLPGYWQRPSGRWSEDLALDQDGML